MPADTGAEYESGGHGDVVRLGDPVVLRDGRTGDCTLFGRSGVCGAGVFLHSYMGGTGDAEPIHDERLVHRHAGYEEPYGGRYIGERGEYGGELRPGGLYAARYRRRSLGNALRAIQRTDTGGADHGVQIRHCADRFAGNARGYERTRRQTYAVAQ